MIFWKHTFAIVIAFSVFRGYVGECQCPNGWVTFQGSCYYFGHGAGLHFQKAKHYCEKQGAQLVQIDSMMESAFLKDYISRLTGQRFWIGLNDLDTEGVWKWLGTNASPTYKDWAPHEPNSWAPVDDCASLAKDYNSQWIDEDCNSNYLEICEMSGKN